MMIKNRYILHLFRAVLGGVFIWSGILKVIDPMGFAQDISNYRIFPRILVLLTVSVLPWIEIFSGTLIMVRKWTRSSTWILSALLIFFLVLISVTLIRGIDINCGCFGPLSKKVDYTLILTDSVLLFLSLNLLTVKSSRNIVRS